MKTHVRLATAAVQLLMTVSSAAAEQQAFLPPQRAAMILADGAPWSADSPSGRSFKLTLNKDGTGGLQATLFSQSLTGSIKGDAVCLSGTMMSKCLRFQQIPGGLQGWQGDQPDLKVTR